MPAAAARPKLQVEYRPLAKLVPYARNSRTHSAEQVAQISASIREWGFTNPVLIDEADGIIAGHGRVLAAQRLALVEVPCIVLRGLTDVQKRAYVLADNKIAINAGWDAEMLALELSSLIDAGLTDLVLTGSGATEIEELLAGMNQGAEGAGGGEFGDGEADDEEEDDPGADKFQVFSPERVATQAARELVGKRYGDFAPTLLEAMIEINRGARGKRIVHTVADRWYPQRHDVTAGQKRTGTPNDRLQDEAWIKKVALYVCSDQMGQQGTRGEVLAMLRRYNMQGAGQFPPSTAREIYLKYAPKGGRILDPCSGWGGRLIGWLAARLGGQYVGFDAAADTVASAHRMIEELRIEGASVTHGAFEDQKLEPGSYDFAFTSPPYFDIELYSQDPQQSTERYPTYEKWRKGFLRPFVANTLAALRPGAHFVVNISDAGEHKLAAATIELAKAAGAQLVQHAQVVIGQANGGLSHGANEDLVVLRRP